MDFFARQRQVKKISARLIALYAVAVLGIVLAVDLAVAFAFRSFDAPVSEFVTTVVVTSVLTLGVILLASLFRTIGLRAGGGRVAQDLGGVAVPQDTTDLRLRRLRNVVEEVALASGVPVPEVYVLEHEPGINAFAAGWSPADAAIAVTRGALDRLNRDELQGVIAHEFSHVVNGDMRINIRLIGLLFGILFLAIIGRTFLNAAVFGGRGRRDQGNNPLPLIGLALLAAGSIGLLAGRLIQASVSRQREYLADASAVQFTRQTSGIAGALKKIGGLGDGSRLRTPKVDEVGHLLFGPGARLSSLFATHPPLVRRIQAIEPDFDPAELRELARRWSATPPSGMAEDVALGLTGRGEAATVPSGPRAAPPRTALPATGATIAVRPDAVTATVGTPTQQSFRRAGAIMDQIPAPILARARRGDLATPLVFGLLLSDHPEARSAQLAALGSRQGDAVARAAATEAGELSGLGSLLRLPLAELAFPALRAHAVTRREELIGTVDALIRADGRISVFEYALSRLLHRDLYEATYDVPPWPVRRRTLSSARPAALTLLAVLALAGNRDPGRAEKAFRAGATLLLPGEPPRYLPPERGVLALDAVWPDLDGLDPRDKERLVAAVIAVVGDDGTMTVDEQELTRTVCGMLRCPLPPMTELG
jgi:Zn-dependent protease with chaperone function